MVQKADHEVNLDRTEMSMITITWTCGSTLKQRKEECRTQRTLGSGNGESGDAERTKGKLRWFGCDEREDYTDWIKRRKIREVEVVRERTCGRQRKTR